MNTISNRTIQMIASFLEMYSGAFGNYLAKRLTPTNADVITKGLRNLFGVEDDRPVIDRKFFIAAYNPVNGKAYTNHDAILLCAKDRAVPAALHAYQAECMRIGANEAHVASIGLLIGRVVDYQTMTESHVPDTVGAEIDRCLYGAGI